LKDRRAAQNFRHKIICDPVHGDIGISEFEQQLIDAPSFQRLRRLRQLGLASLVYPNASHSRFAHSLGVFHIMSRIIDLLIQKGKLKPEDKPKLRVAALLHDIGHYPYSHLMELLDRDKYRSGYLVKSKSSKPQKQPVQKRYPDHERIGQLVITRRADIAGKLSGNGFDPEEIASIIRAEHSNPLFNQLIHGSLDMDRLDYLVRDAIGTGVPYGRVDLDYILNNLDVVDRPDDEGTGETEIAVNHKAATAVEHFLVARYFMYKTVYMHKTTFGFEALLRSILYLLRNKGKIYRDGAEIERMVAEDEFLNFHDGYVDRLVEKYASHTGRRDKDLVCLCRALRERRPPKMVHEVAVLHRADQGRGEEYVLFTKDRTDRINDLARQFNIEAHRWIWEDPKNVSFEALGPFVPLSQAADIKPEETGGLVQVRLKDGSICKLVEDPHSIIHHLSQLRLSMSRLYVVPPLDGKLDDKQLEKIREEIQSWIKTD